MPDEMIDIVNNEDIVVNQAMRSVAHQYGLLHRGVHVFLVTSEGRLLVQKRGKLVETFPLAFDCSISEHVMAEEDYLQAAVRGLQEELGISGVEIQPLVKFKMDYGPNDLEICTLYEARVDPQSIKLDPMEVENISYFYLDELVELILSGEEPFTSWFVQIINWYLEKPSAMTVLGNYSPTRLLFSKSNGG